MDRSSLDLGIWKRLKNLIRSLLPIDLFQIFALNIYLRKALQSSSASFRRIVSFGRFSVERRCCMSLANSVTRATLCDESNPVLNPISLRKCLTSTRILFTPSPKVRWWAVLLRKENKISTQPERTIFYICLSKYVLLQWITSDRWPNRQVGSVDHEPCSLFPYQNVSLWSPISNKISFAVVSFL